MIKNIYERVSTMGERLPLIVDKEPRSSAAEAYRMLRTNIQFLAVDKPLQVILVTSSGMQEGKTTTVANLSITFAQMGIKVLAIDCDLRRPKLHKMFNLDNKKGLSNFLLEQGNLNDYIIKTSVDKLDIITSGYTPPNPSELFSSNAMKNIMLTLRENYQTILIDSPPISYVTDATILSKIVDATILVVHKGKEDIDILQRSVITLKNVDANIVGIILNKSSKESKSGYYYYYYNDDSNGKKKGRRGKGFGKRDKND
jgi:capsular exopolysaccharide synthesis family protein